MSSFSAEASKDLSEFHALVVAIAARVEKEFRRRCRLPVWLIALPRARALLLEVPAPPFCAKYARRFYFLSTDCVGSRASLQQAWAATVSASPPTGHFEDAFPDLNTASKWLHELPLNNLSEHLNEQIRRGDVLEFFSAKVPAKEVSTWGAASLLALFIFFSINLYTLSEFSAVEQLQCDVAWIALYKSRMARLISALVLPFAVAVGLAWLGFSADRSRSQIVVSSVVVIVAFATSIYVSLSMFRLWGFEPPLTFLQRGSLPKMPDSGPPQAPSE